MLKLSSTREGSTVLYVPEESLTAKDPKTHPAFFNPAAKLNRDVSVAIARAARTRTFLDALAGVGGRGVRIAKEVPRVARVTLVEFNRTSLAIAKRNARANRVASRCEFVHQEANAYLHSRFGRLERFEAVDVDPFGTPAPYVQGALNAAGDGGIVSLTATDTATLCGVYPKVALRRYGARVGKSEFPHEAGVRILLGFCARVGGSVDAAIEPVAAHATLHYIRVYFRVVRGARRSDESLGRTGLVATCLECHESEVVDGRVVSCSRCGGRVSYLGPLWTGRLVEERIVGRAASDCARRGWEGAEEALSSLKGVDEFPPFGFSLEAVTSREGLSSVKFQSLVDRLKASGRSAIRQPFGSHGIKTDATYEEVRDAVKRSSR